METTTAPRNPMTIHGTLPRSRLGKMVRLYCSAYGVSERDLAGELGMNVATFHRLMHGHEIELGNFVPFLNWLLEAPRGDKRE
jgi:hypothetical protein